MPLSVCGHHMAHMARSLITTNSNDDDDLLMTVTSVKNQATSHLSFFFDYLLLSSNIITSFLPSTCHPTLYYSNARCSTEVPLFGMYNKIRTKLRQSVWSDSDTHQFIVISLYSRRNLRSAERSKAKNGWMELLSANLPHIPAKAITNNWPYMHW